MGASSGRNARILVDRGADEHVCPTDFASAPPLEPTNCSMLYEAQGHVNMRLGPEGQGVGAEFSVTNLKSPILSMEKLVNQVHKFVVGPTGCNVARFVVGPPTRRRQALAIAQIARGRRSSASPVSLFSPSSPPALATFHLVFDGPGRVQSLGGRGDFPANEVDVHLGLLDGFETMGIPICQAVRVHIVWSGRPLHERLDSGTSCGLPDSHRWITGRHHLVEFRPSYSVVRPCRQYSHLRTTTWHWFAGGRVSRKMELQALPR